MTKIIKDDITDFLDPEKRPISEIATEAKRRQNYKCITAGNNPRTAVIIGSEFIECSAIPVQGGTRPNGFGTHLEGNVIRGPTSIMASLDRIQLSGCWVLNPFLMSGLPSSVATPVPTLSFALPFQAAVRMVTAIKTIGGASGIA